jgi:glycosyltransferase involved in cell wall biosynthesis
MALKSVHLASTHRAGDPRIFHKECRTLAEAGYEVVLVVPHERDEVVGGVQIRAVPVPASGKDRLRHTLRDVYRRALAEGPDAVYHLHDAELLPAGLALKARGRRVVYDAHEDTPKQVRYQHWIPRRMRPPVALGYAALERLAGRLFDGIITAEPPNAERFPSEKVVVIHNYPIVSELEQAGAVPYADRDALVVYVGSISRVRGAEEMVRMMRWLPDALRAELVLAGGHHPASLRDALGALAGPVRLTQTGYVDRPGVAEILARARVGLAVLHPVQKYVEAYPTKLFEYMAAGLPVVVSDFPGWRAIVDEAGCGLAVDPLDEAALAGAVRWLLEHPAEAEAMGRRGQAAVRERYGWAHEGRRLVGFYERLAAGLPPAA